MSSNNEHRVIEPFEPADWVGYAIILALVVGGVAWWRLDWREAVLYAGAFYLLALLTIITIKH